MIFHKNKKYISTAIFAVLLVAAVVFAWPGRAGGPTTFRKKTPVAATKNTSATEFDKTKYPVSAADSLWVVVNKGRQLPADYTPANLVVPSIPLRLGQAASEMHVRSDTATALEAMAAAAKSEGVNLMLASGYRSYSSQLALHQSYADGQGPASADTFSARAGHSEHQTGLAADVEPASRQCEVAVCFENLSEGKWLAANSYKYGFIVRYQKNNQNLTGYQYEPWHIRYVGNDLAAQIYSSGQTLEQFFGLAAYTDYPAQITLLEK